MRSCESQDFLDLKWVFLGASTPTHARTDQSPHSECRYEARWQAAQAAKKPVNPPADVTPKEPAKPSAAANTAASIAETMKPLQVWLILDAHKMRAFWSDCR